MKYPLLTIMAALVVLDDFAAAGTKPNIVLILADDLGYGDVGCYNKEAKVPTPQLDRLFLDGATERHVEANALLAARTDQPGEPLTERAVDERKGPAPHTVANRHLHEPRRGRGADEDEARGAEQLGEGWLHPGE